MTTRSRRPALPLLCLCLLAAVLEAGCAGALSSAQTAGSPAPAGLHGAAPQQVQYQNMTDALAPDPLDSGKQVLTVSVHVHADSAAEGVLAFLMQVDPSAGPAWPRPAYAGGSPDRAAQQVKLPAGDGQVSATFPLRVRQDGKVQPDQYNIQGGGFFDVAIYGGGLPASPADNPLAAFQTSRQYSLPDFGGPPPTATTVPSPTPVVTAPPSGTNRPTPTFAPTSTPAPSPTPLPPPFAVGLLAVQFHDTLTGSVGAVPGVGQATIAAPPGQAFVVGIFAVRRDLETSTVNPLPMQLSAGSGGPWKPDNGQINAKTGSLLVALPPYGPLTIVYDPRNQLEHERRVAAQVWLVPASAATDTAALRFDGRPAAAYPMAGVSWVDPGFPYHLKDTIKLNDQANVQVMSVDKVAAVDVATPNAAPTASPAPPGLRATLAITGSSTYQVILRLQLILEDRDGLRAQAGCPVQTYTKLAAGSPQQFTCSVPLPAGGPRAGYHLAVTGSVNGIAIPVQWVDLGT